MKFLKCGGKRGGLSLLEQVQGVAICPSNFGDDGRSQHGRIVNANDLMVMFSRNFRAS